MFGIAWIQRKLLFPTHLVRFRAHAARPPEAERFWLTHGEGRVEVWFIPGAGVSAERPGPVVIFAHGNGELIDDWPALLAPYVQLGVSVALPEYRGYGRSAGKPSERGIVADLAALCVCLREDPRVDGARMLYHGRSLGGGVVCALARLHPPRGLVLESTFTSVVDAARGMGVPATFIVDRFDSLPVVRDFQGPILIMHGRADTLLPVRHAEQLAAANPRARLVLYDAGHNDLPPSAERGHYWAQIARTVQEAVGAPG